MFAGHHGIDNLILILDSNKTCMLDRCKNVIDLEPLEDKFTAFGWHVERTDGHDAFGLYETIIRLKCSSYSSRPKLLIADTIKGKGVESLELDPLSHTRNIPPDEIDAIVEALI